MGMMTGLMSLLFGGGRNAIVETVEVFRENAESSAQRGFTLQNAALSQLAAEFAVPRKGGFDRFMDGVNRVPRPALVFGILAMFVAAMADPVWFAARMAGLSLVPEPLWWLLGIIVSFYFGARHQVKGQEFQRALAETYSRVPGVMGNIEALDALEAPPAEEALHDNPALADWQRDAG
ncbi:holin family protein [Pseudoruegeria sp. SHC-113]|uniref:holin family protein n=1 Tax=Pseudoruegeria sp. SHC-113 TaxID=2855439 RepID=UPI0021BB3424|nr:holin family protein [Pseudoruegeria sp. SHC-113]MCT8160805.1 holin family protein [Pseudoruegeria sp. SHC-113]